MMHRFVYRYTMIFHDRNFWSIIKNSSFKTLKTLVKVNVKNILEVLCTLHARVACVPGG